MTIFNDEKWQEISDALQETTKANKEAEDKFWSSLSKEDQLHAFCSVVKRIVAGELDQQTTYRYVLYDIFGFEPNSYTRGIDCGYMALHNSIFSTEEEFNFLKGFAKHLGHEVDDNEISNYLFRKYG